MSAIDRALLERWNTLQELLLTSRDADTQAKPPLVFVFRARVSIEEIGARRDDLLILDPSDNDHPVAIYRSLPATSVVDLVQRLSDLELLLPPGARANWIAQARGEEEAAG